jgi:hypothetical protein
MKAAQQYPIIEKYQVLFPDWFEARAELETPAKGHLHGVQVQLEDGATFALTFYDPIRLQQTLEDDVHAGRGFFAEPGLVVVPEVTCDAVRKAVQGLWQEGFFGQLKPLS